MSDGKVGCIIVLIIFIPFIVGLSLLLPESDLTRPIIQLQTTLLCDPDQHLQADPVSYVPGEIQLDVNCVDDDGTTKAVTWRLVLLILASMCFPFVILLIAIAILGNVEITRESDDLAPSSETYPDLSTQLLELENAYQKRLLTREEYDDARRKILDSLGK